MSKIPVYFMPGMAASSAIFENIVFPEAIFEMCFLEWILPYKNEFLLDYSKRMVAQIKHQNIVLIGVSFGGVVVQEMAQLIAVRKLIIISSIKTNAELPLKMKFAKQTKVYKLMPTTVLQDIEKLKFLAITQSLKKRFILYKTFLLVRDKQYLDWAIEQMICWDRVEANPNVIHIHGTADTVFSIKNMVNVIAVKGGTHAMILTKAKWLNQNLPKIILE